MKSINFTIIFIFFLLIVGCNHKQKKTEKVNFSSADTVLKGDDKHFYSNYRLKQIADSSKYKFGMLYVKNDVLFFCCADGFSDLFRSMRRDSIAKNFPNFNVKNEYYKDTSSELDEIVYKYYYGQSFFKTYYYKNAKSYKLLCADIKDESIKLKNGTYIGMSKELFLSLLLNERHIQELMKYGVVSFSTDDSGEDMFYYIFEKNKLKRIIVNTDFDWVNKELKIDDSLGIKLM